MQLTRLSAYRKEAFLTVLVAMSLYTLVVNPTVACAPPGQYKMTWTEAGTSAEVTFSQGKKPIATVPAQVSQVRSGYDGPVLHTDTVANTLTAVALPKTFSFSNDNALTGN